MWGRRNQDGRAGYTLLELMIAAAVASTGLFASLNMATYAQRGNTELVDSTTAVGLAEHLLGTMQAEAAMWVDDHPAATAPLYLKHLPVPPTPGQGSEWLTAGSPSGYAKDKRVGDIGGDDIVFDVGMQQELPSAQRPRFCAHYKLTWVGTELARVEIRVSWPRPHVPLDTYKDCPAEMLDQIANVNSVALAGSVMRNRSVR